MKAFPFLLLLGLSSYPAQALRRPIDGGEEVKIPPKDLYQMTEPSVCTLTRISVDWLITAAHCVVEGGVVLSSVTIPRVEVVSIHVNPGYLKARKADKTTPEGSLCEGCEGLDVALIRTRRMPRPEGGHFATLVSEATTLPNRREITVYGYGDTTPFWDGKSFESMYRSGDPAEERKLQLGKNVFEDCDYLRAPGPVRDLEKFSTELTSFLTFKAKREHSIVSGQLEVKATPGAGLLPGDSGGPVIEKDGSGKNIITGISSATEITATNLRISVVDTVTGAVTEIPLAGKKHTDDELRDWELFSKADAKFPFMKKYLKAAGFLDRTGKVPAQFVVKRTYDVEYKSYVVNLANKENQTFLKQMLNPPKK